MKFTASYTNTNGVRKEASLIPDNIDKLFIVLDYNPKGERGNDKSRDKIEFVTPKRIIYTLSGTEIKKAAVDISYFEKKYVNPVKTKYFPLGKDTLTDIGWKGIYAINIEDAYEQVKNFLKDQKVKTIVIRSHGGVGKDTDGEYIIGMYVDNNWIHLSIDDQKKSGEKMDTIESTFMKIYLNNKNDINFEKENYPEMKIYIEALVGIINYVQDDGDFVVGSCHSAFTPDFISPLQLITGSRINMYGIYFLSHFPHDCDKNIIFTYIFDKTQNTWTVKNRTESIENGIAYITKETVFSDTSILRREDLNKKKMNNYAYKFPVGWQKGDEPIMLNDLKLNKDGVKY